MLSLALMVWTQVGTFLTADHVIRPAGETSPMALAVNSPTHEIVGLRISEIIALADEAAAASSDFDVVELSAPSCLEPSHSDELFLCLGDAALAAYGIVPTRDPELPFSEVLRRLREEKVRWPRYLMVLSIRRVNAGDRVVTSLIDLWEVFRDLRARDLSSGPRGTELEAAIIDDATPARSEAATVDSPGSLRAYLTHLFEVTLRPELERSSHWRPYGTIAVRANVAGAAIRLDDRDIGETEAGTTRLEAISPGRRTIAVVHPGFQAFEKVVELQPGETKKVDAELIAVPDQVAVGARIAVTWSGVAAGVAGVALVAYAVAKPKAYATCIELMEGACEGSDELARFGRIDPGLHSSPNGHGLPIAALGYSLLGMGATWSLATLLFDSDQRPPWYELAAGLVVFGATLGLSYALDGENAVSAGAQHASLTRRD